MLHTRTLVLVVLCLPFAWTALCLAPPGPAAAPPEPTSPDPRAGRKDSYKYYGPDGLWESWTDAQKRGRDTWIFYTAGNQKFYRLLGEGLGKAGVSVDFFRSLDSRRRDSRFAELGLVNEPNCREATAADIAKTYGLWLDVRENDPLDYYPDTKVYGEATGVVGMRRFPNPKFKEDRTKYPEWGWDRDGYFRSPAAVQPPYLVGITCAFCHMSFDPCNPPKDVNRPRWENLSANIGNQFLREGELFLGRGRVVGGNQNPGPNFKTDPYDTAGLGKDNLLYQYGHTQITGTSETSRFSYDFINNPTIITPIYNLGNRVPFFETTFTGVQQTTFHILADGADSSGVFFALQRVYNNIGMEGAYWLDHLWNPLTGTRQRPIELRELRGDVDAARLQELKKRYGDDFGTDWIATEKRIPDLASYLITYGPSKLDNAPGGKDLIDRDKAKFGARAFAKACAECHSNKQPHYLVTRQEEREQFYLNSVLADDFRTGNTFSNDVRYPVTEVKTNAARAMGTNAIDGDIWAELSSKEYKAQPPVGMLRLDAPIDPKKPLQVEFTPPGGGRGYYRTPHLVSLWATAPYLHNNAVGPEPIVAGTRLLDPQYVTVQGRVSQCEESLKQLLDLKPRSQRVLRTTAAAGVGLPTDQLKRMVAGILRGVLDDLLTLKVQALRQALAGEQPALAPLLDAITPALKNGLAADFDAVVQKLGESPELRKQAGAVIEKKVADLLRKHLAERNLPEAAVASVLKNLTEAEQRLAERVAEVLDLNGLFTVPEGTPINLLFNLHIASLPYAVKAFLLYRHQPEELHRILLRLSECPDLVEDRGHYYGTKDDPEKRRQLSDTEKLNLIEFLKTF
jgi:hypothetical protein